MKKPRPLPAGPRVARLAMAHVRRKSRNATFWDEEPLIKEGFPRLSPSCEEYALSRLAEGVPLAQIGHETGTSAEVLGPVVSKAAERRDELCRFLCINEVRAFKKKTAAKRKRPYLSTVIHDGEKSVLIDMLEGADNNTIETFFGGFKERERAKVEQAACDTNGNYMALAESLFPNAVVFVDKFHVVGRVNETVGDVRKRLATGTDDIDDKRALRKADRLAVNQHGKLDAREAKKTRSLLEDTRHEELRAVHLCLQAFRERGHVKHRNKSAMKRTLREWATLANNADVPEMRAAAKCIRSHEGCTLDAWESRLTNAVAEGMSRSVKDVIRACRGFNGFESPRRRMLPALGRERGRREPIPLYTRKRKEGTED